MRDGIRVTSGVGALLYLLESDAQGIECMFFRTGTHLYTAFLSLPKRVGCRIGEIGSLKDLAARVG